jgi:hypothetical protein
MDDEDCPNYWARIFRTKKQARDYPPTYDRVVKVKITEI